jgi:SPP1 family predicted phage head-tail adaptor
MVQAGTYRDRIRVESFSVTTDAGGGAARVWTAIAEVQAQVMELAPGREFFGAGTEVAEGTVRIKIREIPDINLDPAMRLVDVDRGTIYEIRQIVPTRLREELVVLCKHGGLAR